MLIRQFLVCFAIGVGLAFGNPSCGWSQTQVWSAAPPNVEYQYQLYYPRIWGWPGPGLSLGGSLPSKGREGISSFYGRPMPVPLGAGVYVNPFAYSAQLPGPPLAFGLASSTPNPNAGPQQTGQPISQMAGTALPPAPNPGAYGSTIPVAPKLRLVSPVRLESIQRSREMESFGDENLKHQQWTQAYINYHNAVITADERADAHLRLGFACLMLKRFPEAVREFKTAVTLDPTIGKSGETLGSILGPENQPAQTELILNVAKWTKENLRDQDHLFLLGVVLMYNQDPRSTEILEAALRVTGPKDQKDHLMALLTPAARIIESNESMPLLPPGPTPNPPEQAKLPELHQQPLALNQPMP